MPETVPEPVVRVATNDDAELLAGFHCSSGVWYEDVVESFVRVHALNYIARRQPWLDSRLLLYEVSGDELIAVGAHEIADLKSIGRYVEGIYLTTAAISLSRQGAVIEGSSRRLSTFVIEAMYSDALNRDRRRQPVVRAVAAKENARSLALLDRFRLTEEREDKDERYVQRFGPVFVPE